MWVGYVQNSNWAGYSTSPHLPSSCGRKAPGSPQIQGGGRSPPLGSSTGRSYCRGWGDLGWGGSPELGVGAGVEGGGDQWWGTLAPSPP